MFNLLFRFDTGGPGSCLNKYSDPTFFRRASAGFDETYAEKFPRHKKACKRKVPLETALKFLLLVYPIADQINRLFRFKQQSFSVFF